MVPATSARGSAALAGVARAGWWKREPGKGGQGRRAGPNGGAGVPPPGVRVWVGGYSVSSNACKANRMPGRSLFIGAVSTTTARAT